MADCRISYDNQGVATVLDEGGSPSRLYGRILSVVDDQKTAINIWSAAVDPNQGLAGESTTLEDVLRFMDSKAAENLTLSPAEELLMKDVMVRNGFNTLSELSSTLVQLFKPNGVIELPGRDTTGRNLYTQDDLRALDLVTLNNLLQKMEGYLMREQEIYVVPQEQKDLYLNTNDKNALGMSEKLTAEEVSTTLLSKIKDFTNEVEIEKVINESPFAEFAERFRTNKAFRQQILNDLKDLRRIPTLSVVAGQLTDKNESQYITLKNMILSKAPTTVLEAEMEYVASITDFVWRNNPDVVKGLLKEIESELISLNIDVIGLSEHTNSKEVVLDILNEAFQMVKNPTHGNIKSFTDKLQVLIPQEENSIVELIDKRYKDYNIVHVEALGSEVDLFNAYGLIKVGEDLYHKVDQTADINTLIDFLAKRYVEGGFVLPKEFVTAKDLTNKVAVLKDVTNYLAAQKEPLGLANKMLYTAYKKIFDHDAVQVIPTEQVSNITTIRTDEGYLKSDFISDFYRYILEEKAKNSQLYRSVLKHFYISDKDISLKGRPASIKGIKFEQELTDYIKIKRGDKMRYLIEETASPFILEDLVAVNFPETVVEIDETYMMHGPKHAVLPTTPRTFVKLNDKLFRKAGSNLDADIFYQITTPVNPVYLTAITDFTLDSKEAIGHLNNHENLITPVEITGTEADTLNRTADGSIKEVSVEPKAVPSEPDAQTRQQIERFGVPRQDVAATQGLLTQVFSGLKKAGLTTVNTIGDWVGIGRGSEQAYSLKIDGRDVQVKATSPEVVNGFYSPLEKVIAETKFDKLPAKQWIDKFAKGEEAKWTGLTNWLTQQQGSVSKLDIQNYLKENRIEIVEVVKSAPEIDISDLDAHFDGSGFKIRHRGGSKLIMPYITLDQIDLTEEETYEEDFDIYSAQESAKKAAIEEILGREYGDVKFAAYQLEGEKENYKELLVTLPSKEVSYSAHKFDKDEDSNLGAKEGDWVIKNNRGEDVSFVEAEYAKNAQEAMEEFENNQLPYEKDSDSMLGKEVKFKSGHFDEANILVHLRMNTRTDVEGKKVLFLEEVQSDWGQQGKKVGFDNKQLEKERSELLDEKRNLERKEEDNIIRTKVANNGNAADYRLTYKDEKLRYEIAAREKEVNERIAQINNKTGIVAEAPFVMETSQWTKLALKISLKEAIKQGADKIAWTTGEQQADRYSLAEQVNSISVNPNENGRFVFIDMKGNYDVTLSVDDNGKVIEDKNNLQGQQSFTGKNLEDVVGKDMAQKILSETKESKYEGDGLKVGGKGMIGFYGSPAENKLGIVGQVAKSLFKQEPKTIRIDTVKSDEYYYIGDLAKYADGTGVEVFNNTGDSVAEFNTVEEANKFIASKSKQTQHAITITPQMKAEVEEKGQPLFKTSEPKKEFGGFVTRDGKPIGFNYDTEKVARERFDFSKLTQIGKGSDRTVFDLGNDRVLKVAHTARGLEQNIYEGDYYLKGIIPEVFERGLNYVVVENTPRLKAADIVNTFDPETGEEIGTTPAGDMMRQLGKFNQKDFEQHDDKLLDVLGKFGFSDIMSYDVLYGDFTAMRNWGYKNGSPIHLDGGTFGGVKMITSHKGKTNLSDPEFRKIYEESRRLKKQFGDTDKATMFKESEGEIQAQYRVESGKNIIEAIKDFNKAENKAQATTALTHEIMHATVVSIIDGARDGNEVGVRHTTTIVEEFNRANPKSKVTAQQLIADNDTFKSGTTSSQYRAVQEFIAESWEQYHTEGGRGFSEAFQKVLDQITKAFRSVYNSITGKRLTPELRQMFDEILGSEIKTVAKQSLFGQSRNISDYATVLDSNIKVVPLYSPTEANEIVSKIDECQG